MSRVVHDQDLIYRYQFYGLGLSLVGVLGLVQTSLFWEQEQCWETNPKKLLTICILSFSGN